MVMGTIQIRITPGLVQSIDSLVKGGLYSSRSDVIRDAVRRLAVERMVGIAKGPGPDIREIRKKLSAEVKSFKDIEKYNELLD
jgi:Arc/MetJ-type ribon-helix-helix transcriptional regulator